MTPSVIVPLRRVKQQQHRLKIAISKTEPGSSEWFCQEKRRIIFRRRVMVWREESVVGLWMFRFSVVVTATNYLEWICLLCSILTFPLSEITNEYGNYNVSYFKRTAVYTNIVREGKATSLKKNKNPYT